MTRLAHRQFDEAQLVSTGVAYLAIFSVIAFYGFALMKCAGRVLSATELALCPGTALPGECISLGRSLRSLRRVPFQTGSANNV